ncbi:hypothetical protein [Agromyces sp. LHK192]|uniref:hypothetical protein n=1 Tax=Agromyces sp. LHK192 TaxID=2498704 RepID=UPI000FD85298|nr:hypothetical protein [Agromyces sp. LHK192]
MNRLKKSIVTGAVTLALVGGSLMSASPASATTYLNWIQLPTQSRCNIALTSGVRNAVAKGYTNISSSGCYYLQTRKVWEAWYRYTTP